MKIESFKDGVLKIDGKAMSMAEALSNFPKDIKKIYNFVEKSLKETRRQDKLSHMANIEKIKVIKDKVIEIFKNLNLKNDDEMSKIHKIFEYIVKHSNYDEKIYDEKQEIYNANLSYLEKMHTMEINGIYNCLIQNRSDCMGDSVTMAFLLRCLNIEANCVAIGDKDMGNIHNIVKIRVYGKDFYCEPTVFREGVKNNLLNLSKDKILFYERVYKQYLKSNKFQILHVYQPIVFTENGKDMKFEEEKE